eukprot:99563-Pelagomonas_calceolata.AAC.1
MMVCVAPAVHGKMVQVPKFGKCLPEVPPPFREVKFLKEGSWLVEEGVKGVGDKEGAEMETFMMVQSAACAALVLAGLPLVCFAALIKSKIVEFILALRVGAWTWKWMCSAARRKHQTNMHF